MKSHSYYTRLKDQQYRAAGVLPFAVAPAGQLLVLLGRERGWGPRRNTLRWKDFGGHREAIDEDAEATAAREFSEETLGLFGGPEVASCSIAASTLKMGGQLRGSVGTFRVDSPLRNGGAYCMFVAQVAYIEPLLFNLATQENAVSKGVKGAEKCGFAWVEVGHLFAAIEAEEAGSMARAKEAAAEEDVSRLGGISTCQVMENTSGRVEEGAVRQSPQKETAAEFRRSVVAVMVEGPKPSMTAKGRRPKRRRDQKLLLHSSFVCTLRRAQAGGLLDFLSRACCTPHLGKEIQVTTWEGVFTARKRKEREHEGGGKHRKISSECLMYWVLHAQKIGALENGFDAQEQTDRSESPTEHDSQPTHWAKGVCSSGNVNGPEAGSFSMQEESCGAYQSNGKRSKREKERRQEFLDRFPPEQRGTIAGAFHDAVRDGARDPSAVVASVLARAALKMDAMRLQCAPSSKPLTESSGHPAPELAALVDVSIATERSQLLVFPHNKLQECNLPRPSSLLGPPDVWSAGPEAPSEQLDDEARLGRESRQNIAQSLDPENVQCVAFASDTHELLEQRDTHSEGQATLSDWEESARQYAAESHLREGSLADGGESIEAVASTTLGVQTAAAPWADLERRLKPAADRDEALAYARSVIEWASLGSAERKRRKKRRRLAARRR